MKYLERAGIFRLVLRCVIAARDEDGQFVVRCNADLMRKDAGVYRVVLFDFAAERAVGMDGKTEQQARPVEGDEDTC